MSERRGQREREIINSEDKKRKKIKIKHDRGASESRMKSRKKRNNKLAFPYDNTNIYNIFKFFI